MRRFALPVRRLLLAAAAGAVGTLLFAGSASAWTVGAKPAPSCPSGTLTITWTLTNGEDTPADVNGITVSAGTVSPTTTTIPAHGTATVTQTAPADTKHVAIKYKASWKGHEQNVPGGGAGEVTPGLCKSPSPSPSPSKSTSPSPSKSVVAPTSSAPGTGGGTGTLPVTGGPLVAIVVAAIALIGGGVALFLFGRRRRNSSTS